MGGVHVLKPEGVSVAKQVGEKDPQENMKQFYFFFLQYRMVIF
jgi:hypothetical protein